MFAEAAARRGIRTGDASLGGRQRPAVPPSLDSWPADVFELPWTSRTRTSPGERRAERNASREALDAVRKLARGKSRPELAALLTAEYARRSIDVPLRAVVLQAGMLQLSGLPHIRVRDDEWPTASHR